MNRRRFLTRVTGGAILAGGALALISGRSSAQPAEGDPNPHDPDRRYRRRYPFTRRGVVNDRDPTDERGAGRGTGHSDRDPAADPTCGGRERQPPNRITDADRSDPRGNGRGTGLWDMDPTDRYCAGRTGNHERY